MKKYEIYKTAFPFIVEPNIAIDESQKPEYDFKISSIVVVTYFCESLQDNDYILKTSEKNRSLDLAKSDYSYLRANKKILMNAQIWHLNTDEMPSSKICQIGDDWILEYEKYSKPDTVFCTLAHVELFINLLEAFALGKYKSESRFLKCEIKVIDKTDFLVFNTIENAQISLSKEFAGLAIANYKHNMNAFVFDQSSKLDRVAVVEKINLNLNIDKN